MDLPNLLFFILQIIAGVCAIGVLASKHPITAAVNLVAVMLSLAGIYGLLAGPFLGILQVLVYAGAIMMLVIFVIMVLNSAKQAKATPSGIMVIPAVLVPAALFTAVIAVFTSVRDAPGLRRPIDETYDVAPLQRMEQGLGEVDRLGAEMFATGGDAWYVLFEVTGLVLLVAMAGAVLLAKRRLDGPPPREDAA